jgi:hypothetical protein
LERLRTLWRINRKNTGKLWTRTKQKLEWQRHWEPHQRCGRLQFDPNGNGRTMRRRRKELPNRF